MNETSTKRVKIEEWNNKKNNNNPSLTAALQTETSNFKSCKVEH